MATLGSPTSPTSPLRRRKSFFRRLERCCCTTLAYFPLTFVYGLTTWAVWVEVNVSFLDGAGILAYIEAALGVLLWGVLNVSYTIAVFTTPGSPLDPREDWSIESSKRRGGGSGGAYEGLPTYEPDSVGGDEVQELPHGMTTVTAKSSGKPRYCKEMPDRQARPISSLQHLRTVCVEDGPSLSLARDLRGVAQLQAVSALPGLYFAVLLALLLSLRILGVGRYLGR